LIRNNFDKFAHFGDRFAIFRQPENGIGCLLASQWLKSPIRMTDLAFGASNENVTLRFLGAVFNFGFGIK
jgi:hypothetical protein